MTEQGEILLRIVAGGMKPVLDEIRERLTALEVENKLLRDRLSRQAPIRPALVRPASRRP